MNIISLVLLNFWKKITFPRNVRVLASAGFILLALTQLLVLLVIIPGFGKMPTTLEDNVKMFFDPAGRKLADIWMIFVNVLVLAALRFKVWFIAFCVIFAAAAVFVSEELGDKLLEENKWKAFAALVLIWGAAAGLALFEVGAYLVPALF